MDVSFEFIDECLNAFYTLKKALISAPMTNHPIGHYPLKECVMLVIMPLVRSLAKPKIKSIIQSPMLAKH
jgi:hypothetical protein